MISGISREKPALVFLRCIEIAWSLYERIGDRTMKIGARTAVASVMKPNMVEKIVARTIDAVSRAPQGVFSSFGTIGSEFKRARRGKGMQALGISPPGESDRRLELCYRVFMGAVVPCGWMAATRPGGVQLQGNLALLSLTYMRIWRKRGKNACRAVSALGLNWAPTPKRGAQRGAPCGGLH